jgi:hypothetical protein
MRRPVIRSPLTWIRNWYLRRKATLHETPTDRYDVRIARNVREYQDAFRLLHVAYVYQGIEPVHGMEMRITPQHVLPESTVFVAYEGETLVGTMTVTLDSPAGLPLDHDYPAPLERLRARGATMVEFGALAVVRKCWHTGVTTLLNIAAHWFSWEVLRASHCVMGIHPKAAPFYDAVYDFVVLGAPRPHAELAAPVQGMVHELAGLRRHLVRHFRRPMATGLTPGEHFTVQLPPNIHMPEGESLGQLARWKLPREVFRELFIEQSDRLDSLDQRTREQLEGWRSLHTLNHKLRRPVTDETVPYGMPVVHPGEEAA